MTKKLAGLPKIIYLNNKSDTDKREYIESQFKKYNIEDYERVEKLYNIEDYEEWKKLILNRDLKSSKYDICETINLIDAIIKWYDSEESEVCIFSSDILNLDTVNYWFFDWKYLIKNLPYNWDCIKLFYSSLDVIKMHLHPWKRVPGFGMFDDKTNSSYCFMITRYFAKRLKHYHYVNGKFNLHYDTPDNSIIDKDYGTINDFFFDLGITYNLPVFCMNRKYLKNSRHRIDLIDKLCSESIDYWWRLKSRLSSTFYFFNYNKIDEWKMEVLFDYKGKDPNVFMDDLDKTTIWI